MSGLTGEGVQERRVDNNCENRIRIEQNSLSFVDYSSCLEEIDKRGTEPYVPCHVLE